MKWRWFLCATLTLCCAFFLRFDISPAQADNVDPEMQAKEYAKFTLTNQVRVYIEGILAALSTNATIVSPLTAGKVAVAIDAANATVPTSQAAAPKQPICTTLANLAATDAAPAVALPASADNLYLVTIVGDGLVYETGAAPAPAYGAGRLLPPNFVGYLTLTGANISMDCDAGGTADVSIQGCTYQ